MNLTDLNGSTVEFVELPMGRDLVPHTHRKPHACVALEGTLIDDASPRREILISEGDFRLSSAGTMHHITVPDSKMRCVVLECPSIAYNSSDNRIIQSPKLVSRLREAWGEVAADISPARRTLIGSEILAAARNASAAGDLVDRPDWISEAERLLVNADQTSIMDVARMAGVHRATLTVAFRREFGMSPRTYRLLHRLDSAAGILTRRASPSAAAAEAGFFDQAHMNKAWRRFLGGTPGAWAQAHNDKRTRQGLCDVVR